MRTLLLVALLVASSAVAFMPSAAASPSCMPEEPCDPQPIDPPIHPDCRKVPEPSPLVVVSDDCKLVVSVDVVDCLWGERWVTYTAGPLTLEYTVCEQPYEAMPSAPPCMCPPPVDEQDRQTMADPFPTCVRECFPVPNEDCELQDLYYAGPVGFPVDIWGGDCDIDVDPIGACAPPSGDYVERHIGPIHLKLLLCGGDVPDWS